MRSIRDLMNEQGDVDDVPRWVLEEAKEDTPEPTEPIPFDSDVALLEAIDVLDSVQRLMMCIDVKAFRKTFPDWVTRMLLESDKKVSHFLDQFNQ